MLKKFTIVTGLSAAFLMGGAFQTNVDAAAISPSQDHQLHTSNNYTIHSMMNGDYQQLPLNNQHQQMDQETGEQQEEKVKPEQQEKSEQEAENENQEKPKQEVEKQSQEKTTAPEQQQQQKANQEEQKQTSAKDQELSAFEQEVVELTNEEREKQGLDPLKADAELSKVAREKSRDMSENNYFSHDSPNYGSPFDMMQSFGIDYSTAGENIARGQQTPEEVVNGWMNSDGHRANILKSDFTHIGVGYVEQGDHWTQQFIGK